MIITLLILGSIAAWAVASRALFRHWVRNDTLMMQAGQCSHGYRQIHKSESCHPDVPLPHRGVAAVASLAGLFLPAILFFVFITARPPLGRRELAERTKALEAENKQLRREQERWNDPY